MIRKKFTRRTPHLFTDLRKQSCPLGHFQTEDDLFHAYVDWLDYHDPIGFVRNWSLRREYEPEAEDLATNVQLCRNAEEFTQVLRQCLVTWFAQEDLKPHFLHKGFRAVAEDGWVLWRRFVHDMRDNPVWIQSRIALQRFDAPALVDDDRLRHRFIVSAGGVDCLFEHRMHSGGTLSFCASDVRPWTDTELVERARATGRIHDKSAVSVQRAKSEWVTVAFDWPTRVHPDAAYVDGPSPRHRRCSVIEVE